MSGGISVGIEITNNSGSPADMIPSLVKSAKPKQQDGRVMKTTIRSEIQGNRRFFFGRSATSATTGGV